MCLKLRESTPKRHDFLTTCYGYKHVVILGGRRFLSSSAPAGGAPPPTAAGGGGVQSQSQLHRGKKAEGKERRLWPYIKAAKQQFFNVVLATLSIVMAAKMVEGKVLLYPSIIRSSFFKSLSKLYKVLLLCTYFANSTGIQIFAVH